MVWERAECTIIQHDNVIFLSICFCIIGHMSQCESTEASSWDTTDFYPVNDCSVLFLNPRVHYMVSTWRRWEGGAPTKTNNLVAISYLIKWLLPVFVCWFVCWFVFCVPSQSMCWEYTCISSSVLAVNRGRSRKWFYVLHNSTSVNIINTLGVFFLFFLFFLRNKGQTKLGLKSQMVWFI